MADEAQLVKKRLRIDEDGYQTLTLTTTTTTFKRQKSYDDHVISLLIEEEGSDESEPKPTQQLSDAAASPAPGDDDVRDSVLRHLLEASDDELGLVPTKSEETGDDLVILEDYSIDVEGVAMEGSISIDVGGGGHLWEIQDEAANYYALMQAQLFM